MKMAEGNQYIYFFGEGEAEGDASMRSILGGKGVSLHEMTKAGFPIPPGFTIFAECCDAYFRNDKTLPAILEYEIKANLSRLEEITGCRLSEGDTPLLVSVRSGAAVSMPGMMDTILNVGLNPTAVETLAVSNNERQAWLAYRYFIEMFGSVVAGVPESVFGEAAEEVLSRTGKPERESSVDEIKEMVEGCLLAYKEHAGEDFPTKPWDMLLMAIEAVFNSWLNERAVAYREAHKIEGLLGTAVNIQCMVPSEVAGITFTANPNTGNRSEMVIESSWGLGEAIVSGKVSPDVFIVNRNTFEINNKVISEKDYAIVAASSRTTEDSKSDVASLTDEQIRTLVEMCIRVETLFGAPQDVEWAWASGVLYLLQSRNIRNLEVAEERARALAREIERLQNKTTEQEIVWGPTNLAETLPHPLPLTFDVQRRFMSGSGGYGLMYQDLGYFPSKACKEEGMLELICGRMFINLQLQAQMYFDQYPIEYDYEDLREHPENAAYPPTKFNAQKAPASFWLKLPYYIVKMLMAAGKIGAVAKKFHQNFEETILRKYLAYIAAERQRNLSELSSQELFELFESHRKAVMDDFAKDALKPSFFGGMSYGAVEQILTQHLGEEGRTLAQKLIVGLDGDKTVEENIRLYEVAHGKYSIEYFLSEFGHRGVGEFELAQPRWREDRKFVDEMIKQFKSASAIDPAKLHAQQKTEREAATEQARQALPQKALRKFDKELTSAVVYLPYRETWKHYFMMGYELIRQVALEIGRRTELKDDVFWLHIDELKGVLEDEDFSDVIAERKSQRKLLLSIDCPDVVFSSALEAIGRPQTVESMSEYSGLPVSPGVATGTAKVVVEPSEASNLGTGYVLVCNSTDPGWTPLFVNASALVMERGGMLSHGAIVARGFGIPAVVNIKGITRNIPAGAQVKVDGNEGKVYLLE